MTSYLNKECKKYYKGLDEELQNYVVYEIREGLSNECFFEEDIKAWDLEYFKTFVEDVRSFHIEKIQF